MSKCSVCHRSLTDWEVYWLETGKPDEAEPICGDCLRYILENYKPLTVETHEDGSDAKLYALGCKPIDTYEDNEDYPCTVVFTTWEVPLIAEKAAQEIADSEYDI